MPAGGEGSTEFYEALSAPERRAILWALGRTGPMRFSELLEATGIESSGKLAFHLKKLSRFVTKFSDEYTLTTDGIKLLRVMEEIEGVKLLREPRRDPVLSLLPARLREVVLVSGLAPIACALVASALGLVELLESLAAAVSLSLALTSNAIGFLRDPESLPWDAAPRALKASAAYCSAGLIFALAVASALSGLLRLVALASGAVLAMNLGARVAILVILGQARLGYVAVSPEDLKSGKIKEGTKVAFHGTVEGYEPAKLMEAILAFLHSGGLSAHPKAYIIDGLRVVHHEHFRMPALRAGEEVQVIGTFACPGLVFASQAFPVRDGGKAQSEQD